METIPEEKDEDPLMTEQEDVNEVDTIAYAPEESDEEPFNMAIDDTSEDPTIVMGKPVTTAFISDDVHIPTEKVGVYKLLANSKSSLIIFHQSQKKRLLNRYTRYYKH